jgi:pyruvate formate-lyase activating enzyme-like uncharacterized protein
VQNPDILPPRVALYDRIEAEYIAGLEAQGVHFASACTDEAAKAAAIVSLQERGARVRNGGASISVNNLSSACVACTGDRGSKTFLLSLLCDRQCYFCFNPNQLNYAEQRCGLSNWQAELDEYSALNAPVSHIALTGGEPLVHAEETVSFFETVRARYPAAHTRLYTTGDRLDTVLLEALAKAELTEIRFSVKIDDPPDALAQTLRHIVLARDYIPQVMVEMPAIPGTGQEMRSLLDTLDGLGIYGINLLEFCFPRHNWPEFESRGFRVKNPPFPVLYEYGYAGGLPIAGSEELSLELLSYALDQGMRMGLHYCSLENKHCDEVYQLNVPYATAFASYLLDPEDFFLKTVVAFGEDAQRLELELLRTGVPYERDPEDDAVQFNPQYFERFLDLDLRMYCSYNVVAMRDGEAVLRELKLTELLKD